MSPDFSKNFATQTTVDAIGKQPSSDAGNNNNSKNPSASTSSDTGKRKDLRYVLAVVLFALSIVTAGGVFGFNVFLNREVETIDGNIATLDDTFKIKDIEGILLFDKQVQTLKDLNVSRGGYSILLSEISRLVVPGAYYTSVSISLNEKGSYRAEIRGFATSLEVYYQQLRSFRSAEGLLEGIVKSEGYSLQRSEGGSTAVLFTVTFEVSVTNVAAQIQGQP